MDPMIAYCGLTCTSCEAYVATQANDREALERLAAYARENYGQPDATAEGTMCDGCLSNSDRLCGYCAVCDVRACAMALNLANCAHCTDYGCAKLANFWSMAGEARTTLDAIRAGLHA
ncbi:MAG TPA: DUF3795 domain-containing protein [Anaerolineae bacterium]|nr:DUF3795 domain-containing protein [Anaerolineae bacterium]